MKKEKTAPLRTGPKQIRTEEFLPVSGSLEEQVQCQVDFLTDALVHSMVRASGRFDAPEQEEAEANPWLRPAAQGSNAIGNAGLRRAAELRIAAMMSHATADLIASYARLRSVSHQKITIRHLNKPDRNSTHRGDSQKGGFE